MTPPEPVTRLQTAAAVIGYLWYVVRHKVFVLVAGLWVGGIPLARLVVHDWTKFSPQEFMPYARYFYRRRRAERAGVGELHQPGADPEFDRAWEHHWTHPANRHHWNAWVRRDAAPAARRAQTVVALAMDEAYDRELVADWIGAGWTQGKPDIGAWYGQHRDRILLHPATRASVERILHDLGYAW